jgi:hypothetical protein
MEKIESVKKSKGDQSPLPAGLNRWLLNNLISICEELKLEIKELKNAMSEPDMD